MTGLVIAVVVGMVGVALSARGGDGSGAVDSVGATTTVLAMPEPMGGSGCPNGVELARTTLPTGEEVRYLEARERRQVCVVGERSGMLVLSSDGPPQESISSPQLGSAASTPGQGWHYVFLLPAGFATEFTARDEFGSVLGSVISVDGGYVVIYDHDVSPQSGPGLVPRTFDLVDAAGALIARLSFTGAPHGSAPLDPMELLVCLRAQGLDLPDPPAGDRPLASPAPQPLPPDVALPAWQACRDIQANLLTQSGMPDDQIADQMSLLDCLAGRGWLQVVLGDVADLAAHNAAQFACEAQSPSTRAVVACLQANGLDITDPAADPGSTAGQPYPPQTAQSAWQACRDVYAASLPPALVEEALAVQDCMAASGWINAVILGTPTDPAYYVAYQACRPS